MNDRSSRPVDPRLVVGAVTAWMALLGGKLWLASTLGLHGDEAFFWQYAKRLSIDFVDQPPLTALLVRLGTTVLGNTELGVRGPFILIGALFPWTVYLLARRMSGPGPALRVMLYTLVVPGLVQVGWMAYPDGAMLMLAVVFLLLLDRAVERGTRWDWIALGLCGAVGVLAHYRWVLVLAAAAIHLVLHGPNRRLLRRPGPWLAALLTLPAFAPILVINLRMGFEPVRYYLAGRHGATVRLDRIEGHLVDQLLMLSPVLYVALLAVAVHLFARARRGERRAHLAVCLAATHLGLFLAASPFEATQLTIAHWPLPGYLGLLVFLPGFLRGFVARRPSLLRRTVATLPALSAAALIALGLLELATGFLETDLRRQFVRWREIAGDLEPYRNGNDLVVAGNYKLGARLEFYLRKPVELFVMDHHINHEHGRAPQLDAWHIDETALSTRVGANALVVSQWSDVWVADKESWPAHMATFFEELEHIEDLTYAVPARRKKHRVLRLFRGVRVVDHAGDGRLVSHVDAPEILE